MLFINHPSKNLVIQWQLSTVTGLREEINMAYIEEIMELTERICLYWQEVPNFIHEQHETARGQRRLQRQETGRQITHDLEISRLNNERPANLHNARNNGKAPILTSFTDETDRIDGYLMGF